MKKPNKLNASKAKFKGKLEKKEAKNCFILTYIVAHKEIIGIRSIDEIVELAVDITANCHRTLHRLYVPLLDENHPRLIAKRFHLCLLQRLALHQTLDLTVQIHMRRHCFMSFSVTNSLSLSLRSDLHHRDPWFLIIVFWCILLPCSPSSPSSLKSSSMFGSMSSFC